MPIYLDHAATTRVWPEVIEGLTRDLCQMYANPASAHRLGQHADKHLNASRQQMAALLGCKSSELILTSGGSESINLALKGYLGSNPRQGRRIITSQGEHSATHETAAYLSRQGGEVLEIELKNDGRIDLDQLAEALRQPAAMISLIHVSNETGAINDIESIVRLRNSLQPSTVIHLDAVQAFGKIAIDFARSGVDMMSGSGHKIGGPKGVGWLIARQGIRLTPLIHGGGQQQGLRSGTENPPMAAALVHALQLSLADLPGRSQAAAKSRDRLLGALKAQNVVFSVLSPSVGVPHILSISFPGLRGETLLHALEAREIYISTGAACSSKQRKANRVLQAMHVPAHLADCAVRISFSAENTADEIDQAAQAIAETCRWLIKLNK